MNQQSQTYEQLYHTYVNELYSYGVGLGFDKQRCMDAIHDVFCKMVVSGKGVDNIHNIKLYLFRSIKNRLIDMQRQYKNLTYEEPNHRFCSEVSVVENIIDTEEQMLVSKKVQALMDMLTDNQREAVYLRYMQEMDYEDIAVLLNISPASARKLVYRALEKIRSSDVAPYFWAILLLIHKLPLGADPQSFS